METKYLDKSPTTISLKIASRDFSSLISVIQFPLWDQEYICGCQGSRASMSSRAQESERER